MDGGMTIAMDTEFAEAFSTHGRRYVWREGGDEFDARGRRLRGRRESLRFSFFAVVVPGMKRRGARRVMRSAVHHGGAMRAHWVTWQCPGEVGVVWGLFVATGGLAGGTLGGLGMPANDGAMLAAWGDGPVMAWVSDRDELREVLREALRSLPEFLAGGVLSGDEGFPVRVLRAGYRRGGTAW